MGLGEYFDRAGAPMTMEAWAAAMGDPAMRCVARTNVGDVCVSTVWLGIDHRFLGDGPPIIFETMVFGGPLDQEQWRYTSEADALAGHAEAVEVVEKAQ